jgi:hypothetical protein
MATLWGYRHTLRIYNTYCFSTATMVTRTRLTVTFVRTLPVLSHIHTIYIVSSELWRLNEKWFGHWSFAAILLSLCWKTNNCSSTQSSVIYLGASDGFTKPFFRGGAVSLTDSQSPVLFAGRSWSPSPRRTTQPVVSLRTACSLPPHSL